jgi:hypothetical protein
MISVKEDYEIPYARVMKEELKRKEKGETIDKPSHLYH